ncbi:hypothetical protein [Pseudoalteromonas luteoviolacea]|uniref:Uncharacterized protein n=1 Tax=Pseudoalteromonas luteoviolacea S4054 TaxID=1129367 RepID=A0A0F6AHI4_9GAMM|nr:hypothetical protein [Pseudoalteromonas luteoviolacea]AOT07694.1 hypothetical protein S4054249_07470 [Pseudoalteromonas luteoviolacea]AOT12610.1 hypothetical protein S40542_07470 [Pseudoalteromonas luteoviolacea]AOT17524.1 hypothetical protein S4054_07470 [Pseudoalteromonas luteoviolacea]KKE85690.1 hypothetical protein N479_25135 [Pseudoalteromonas luteoviolacea S4054]KZN71079.1 hypothetical protein N481_19905 [Pseudoalteromonas luteoviolacea S4047-1]
MEITLPVPNAIVFLYDSANQDIQIPEYIDNVLVAANEKCVSIGTQLDVDGDVTIKLSNQRDDLDKNSCERVFDGVICTPGKKLAVSTSEDEAILQVDVKGDKAKVSVWVDDSSFPSLVLIEVQ